MDHATIAGLVEAIAPVVRQYLGEQMAGIETRLQAQFEAQVQALEAKFLTRSIEPGQPGRDGIDGPEGPEGKPGRDGVDGAPGRDGLGISDALMDHEGHLCLTRSDGVIARLGRVQGDPGRDGVDGKDGVDGADGRDGIDGIGIKDIQRDEHDHAIAFLTDGRSIDLGRSVGRDGSDGAPGRDGADGLPGVGIVRVYVDGLCGMAEFTDGRKESLGRIVGNDGKDGRDGAPGPVGEKGDPGDSIIGPPGPQGESIKGDAGPPGRDGIDGKDADPEFVRTLVTDAVSAMPRPRDGSDGRDGEQGPPGADGKDADPEVVRSLVTEAVAAIPPARDGADGKDGADGVGEPGPPGPQGPPGPVGERGEPGRDGIDGKSIELTELRQMIDDAVIDSMSLIKPEAGPQGPAGKDGADADPAVIRAMVTAAVAAIPPAAPGRDGVDGADADPELIRAMVGDAVSALPRPADGRDGRDGADADPEIIKALVTEAVAALPAPRDGQDGAPGRDGRDGSDADATKALAEMREWTSGEIAHGIERAITAVEEHRRAIDAALATVPRSHMVNADGDLVCVHRDGSTSIAGHVRGENGTTPPGVDHFELDEAGNITEFRTDGRSILIGRVVGRDGRDGKDGRDGEPGLGFDDLSMEQTEERTLVIRLARGERVHEQTIHLAYPLYRGTWKDGQSYEVGDIITYSGGMWVCRQPTNSKPGDGDEIKTGWRLATKAPRNGKSAYDIARANGFTGSEKEWVTSLRGSEGKQGPPGPPGRDRT